MTNSLRQDVHSPTNREILFTDALRQKCIAKMQATPLGELMGLLRLTESGLANLYLEADWNLDTCFRVADLLNLPEVNAWIATLA